MKHKIVHRKRGTNLSGALRVVGKDIRTVGRGGMKQARRSGRWIKRKLR